MNDVYFISSDFDVKDKEHPDQPKKCEDVDMQTLLMNTQLKR